MKKVLKLPVHEFVSDFVRGESDEQLRSIYSLSQSELTRVINALKQRGTITDQDISQRSEQLKIRFGAEDGPPDPVKEGKVGVDLNTGLVLHCPSCAAPVRREAKNCDYCKAPLDFSLKGKTISCPNCFASTPADGRFCIRCARQITGVVEDGKLLEDRLCPRCGVPLRGEKLGEFSLMGCDRCGGVFVPHETFEMMQEKRDAAIIAMSGQHRNEVTSDEKVAYVRCPVCRKLVNRVNFARISGVLVDVCREHGIWFDAGEIEKVMDFISHGGLQRAKAEEVERMDAEEKHIRLKEGGASAGATSLDYGWLGGADPGTVDLMHALGRAFRLFRD